VSLQHERTYFPAVRRTLFATVALISVNLHVHAALQDFIHGLSWCRYGQCTAAFARGGVGSAKRELAFLERAGLAHPVPRLPECPPVLELLSSQLWG